jgi:zeaxanthin glucosyltransferase
LEYFLHFSVLSYREIRLKIAFVALAAPGHIYSTTTLARILKERGHDVLVISMLDTEPLVRGANLPFLPVSEKEYPAGSLRQLYDRLGQLEGKEALSFTLQALGDALRASFINLPRTLREAGVDALVLDEAQRGLGLVPIHLGMPYAHISSALAFDLSGYTPYPFFGWQHENSPEALARNQEGLQKIAPMLEISQAIGSEFAEKVGLTVDWTDPFATISKRAWLTQTPKAFDFKSSHWPSQFHHTGPFHDGLGRVEPDFPWDQLTGEPLLYASMGTLQNGLEPVFSTISEAVERSGAKMQLVLSIGHGLDPSQIRSLPTNAIVVHHAPQLKLLKRAALCITHAGLNTTLESLTQGVPLVAIPVTNDQPGVAARIAYTKTGAYVPLPELSSPHLSFLINEVTTNPVYRQNAIAMKQEITKANGLEKAADLLEGAFGLHSAEMRKIGN